MERRNSFHTVLKVNKQSFCLKESESKILSNASYSPVMTG